MKSAFARYHPAVSFCYFVWILLFSMWFLHPVCLAGSLAGAVGWSVYLKGRRAAHFALVGLLPMLLLMWVVNPLFSHAGATILAYFPNGNPLTLESVLYGLGAAAMLCCVIAWFSCFHEVMTSDKFIYLFGRVIPALSLILSMGLRFVPRFKAQFQTVTNAQKCVGRDSSSGNLIRRCRSALGILSVMVTWSLENAIQTADSMRSRGYGLAGRTAYAIYRFEERDADALAVIGALGLFTVLMGVKGALFFQYFPVIKTTELSVWSVTAITAYLFFCALPLIVDLWEDRKWNCSIRRG